MSGVRVSGLPANVTEKHLKVYFSNPRNGGGRILKIYHPLPHGSAVVLFDDKRVVQNVLERNHELSGTPVDISATPKQVFRRTVVEVEKTVSDFLSMNSQIVDELQFIGEINVNFQYEKERYLLDGTWYQIEWALHYLDTMLDAYQFDQDSEVASRGPNRKSQPMTKAPRGRGEFREESPPRVQIKRPNIPVLSHPREEDHPKSLPVTTGSPMSNFRKMAANQPKEAETFMPRPNKNKNIMPVGGASAAPRSIEKKLYGVTMRSNLDEGDQNRAQNISGAAKRNSGDDNWKRGYAQNKRSFNREADSDSENEADLAAAYDRRVGFSSDTNFDEVKGRLPSNVPRMTKGIDVASTDFGEAPLNFTFELPGNMKVHVAMDDITQQTTDTIINPTTPQLSNIYGVSRAITAAAGMEMQMECRRFVDENGPLNYTGVTHTAAGGSLSKKIGSVLHTAGPSWREETSEYCTHLLVCTYINCFQYADEKLWVQSVATPLISAGAFGFPLDVCIGAFYDAVLLFSSRATTKRHLKEVHLVCFDQDSAMATIMIVKSLIDCDMSQSAVAATDRYWMQASKYNVQAENFGKPKKEDGDTDESDSDASDKNSETDRTGEDKPKDIKKEECSKPKVEAEKPNTFSDSDDDNDDEVKPNEKASAEKDKPEKDAEEPSFEKKFEFGKDDDDSDDSLKDGDNEDKFKSYKDEKEEKGEPIQIAARSSLTEKVDVKNVVSDESDNDSNSDGEKLDHRKVSERNEQKEENNDDIHMVAKSDEIGNERNTDTDEDQNGDEEKDEKDEKGIVTTERKDSGNNLEESVEKTSLAQSEWSIVPGSDVTREAEVSKSEESGEEEGEELYL